MRVRMPHPGEPMAMSAAKKVAAASQVKRDDEAMNKRVIDALKEFKDSLGDQKAVAERLGYSQGHVSKLLRGASKPTRGLLFALVRASGRSADDILGLPQRSAQPPVDVTTIVNSFEDILKQRMDELRRSLGLPAAHSTIRAKT